MWGTWQDNLYSGLNVSLPAEILDESLRSAFTAYGNHVWVGSGMLLMLGFLCRVVREKWSVVRGDKEWPDYGTPIVMLVAYTALISAYGPCVRGCIELIGGLTQGFVSQDELGPAMLERAQALAAAVPPLPSSYVAIGVNSILAVLFHAIAPFLYGVVAWAVWSLKCLQVFVLAVIVIYGPIALSFSFIGGIFTGLGVAWFWSLVEISAWGATFDILNFVLTPVVKTRPDSFLVFNELGLCLVVLVLVRAVPQITNTIVRGATANISGPTSPAETALAVRRIFSEFMPAKRKDK